MTSRSVNRRAIFEVFAVMSCRLPLLAVPYNEANFVRSIDEGRSTAGSSLRAVA